jgi:hypothetical protein
MHRPTALNKGKNRDSASKTEFSSEADQSSF